MTISSSVEEAISRSLITRQVETVVEESLSERENQARRAAYAAAGNLDRIVQAALQDGGRVCARIMREVPTDHLVQANKLRWSDDGVQFDSSSYRVHAHAFGQALERYGVPSRYANLLIGKKGWGPDLLRTVLQTHAENDGGRLLVRSYNGTVRAFLSDRYRRLDSGPLLESFLEATSGVGLIPYSGIMSDVRASVRVLLPEIVDILGDPVVFGLEWSNSDYGAGRLSIRTYCLRLVCINGLVGETHQASVHLGRRLDDSIEYSKKTYQLDTETMISATRDVVQAVASKEARAQMFDRLRTRASRFISEGDPLPAAIRKALTKAEQERAMELFTGPEAVLLPPSQTAWRLSNVLSWMANVAPTPERRMDLERMAGSVVFDV